MNRRGDLDTPPFQHFFLFHLILHPRVFFSFLPFFPLWGIHRLTGWSIGSRRPSRKHEIYIRRFFHLFPSLFLLHLSFRILTPITPHTFSLWSSLRPLYDCILFVFPTLFFFFSCRIEFAVRLSFLITLYVYGHGLSLG